jgi:hypothetical protein
LRSWVIALLAVLDSAALYLSMAPSAAPSEARLCLRMGFTCFREVAGAERVAFDPDPRPDGPVSLAYEDFLDGYRRVQQAGFVTERSPEDAWAHFRGWRVNYEQIACSLAARTGSVPARWSGPRPGLAHIDPLRPLDRTPEDPEDARRTGKGWAGPSDVLKSVE